MSKVKLQVMAIVGAKLGHLAGFDRWESDILVVRAYSLRLVKEAILLAGQVEAELGWEVNVVF